MKISIIVAQSINRAIGKDNQLPWHMPADLKHFKLITMGKPIVMGRKTFESIGKPLPGRRNVILTRDENYLQAGCEVFHDHNAALKALADEPEIMVIGGEQLFRLFLMLADVLYVTQIEAHIEGDTFFPEIDGSWALVSSDYHDADERHAYDYIFQVFERK